MEAFSLARFKLKFRAVLLHSMFSKGPQQFLYFSQNYFDKLEKWFGRNRMQFNRDNYWILHLSRNNELFTCRMQKYRVDQAAILQKRLELIFGHCVNERHQVAVKNDKQESLDRGITSKTHKILFPLCPVLQRSQLDAWVQFQAPFMQKVAKQQNRVLSKED